MKRLHRAPPHHIAPRSSRRSIRGALRFDHGSPHTRLAARWRWSAMHAQVTPPLLLRGRGRGRQRPVCQHAPQRLPQLLPPRPAHLLLEACINTHCFGTTMRQSGRTSYCAWWMGTLERHEDLQEGGGGGADDLFQADSQTARPDYPPKKCVTGTAKERDSPHGNLDSSAPRRRARRRRGI